ncbi:hypothetical protein OS493_018815 [Desmophyllum pertusum]|uniref:Uncharacterized protein n=1 Tax=Desmophyllum pertusum TaxID=174260 RepID=A0A9W9ZC63_9CNID|nr:hypothetical protein OS493_018815 [Desmophyllum pertusum]
MKVVLNDEPRGCLANLTSSCKDIVVSRTLLEKVTHDSNNLSQSEDVVCVSVVRRDMDWLTAWYYGNVDYRCCQKEKRENETMIQCDLPVKYNKWFMVFYHFLTFGIIFAFFYWPAVFILLPDYFFAFEQPHPIENPAREIPVDDFSPNVLSNMLAKQHVENRPSGGETPILKMFGFYYICILCFAYVFLALNYIFFLDIFVEFEAKHAVQENVIFYYLFDIRTNKLYCLIPVIIFFVILPVIIVFFGEEYHSSPLVSGGAVLLSGKLTGMLFRGLLNKPEQFHGWDKIEKSKTIKQEVEDWIKGEDYPRSTWDVEMEILEPDTQPDSF